MFPLEEQQKKTSWPTVTSDRAGKKAIDFTVLEDAYSAVVSRGGGGREQIKPKDKEYCVLTFPDLSLFCYLLVVCFLPFLMEICVPEEL